MIGCTTTLNAALYAATKCTGYAFLYFIGRSLPSFFETTSSFASCFSNESVPEDSTRLSARADKTRRRGTRCEANSANY